MRIEVKQEHIDAAVRTRRWAWINPNWREKITTKCIVAQALKAAGYEYIKVGYMYCWFGRTEDALEWHNGKRLDNVGAELTMLQPRQWRQVLPCTIEIHEDES